MDKETILNRIDELMREKGITQYQLKENADISTTIYQWRKNATRDKNRIPSLRSIEKICEYFEISLSYFFAFDSNTQRELKNNRVGEMIKDLSDEQLKIIELLIKELRRT